MNPLNNDISSDEDNYNTQNDTDNDSNLEWSNPIPPAYYSFPTFANNNNNNNNNINLGYVNDTNTSGSVNQNANILDSYYNPSAVNRINALMSRSTSQHTKEELLMTRTNQNQNQNNTNTSSSSNLRNSKSINNFNNYINNKVSTIKEFTKKNILQIHSSNKKNNNNSNSSNHPPPNLSSNSSSNISFINIDDEKASLLHNSSGTNPNNNDDNTNISDIEITNITIIPTSSPNEKATATMSTGTENVTSHPKKLNYNNNNNNNNNKSKKHNNNNTKKNRHILKRNNPTKSTSEIENTIFNSDQYSPEYDFLIQLLSIPNDNLIVKNAIQHRISYLQEYVDETRRYTKLSKSSKLKKSIIIQAITLFLTLIVFFNTSFFFSSDDQSNNNSNNNESNDNTEYTYDQQQKLYLLKLLGFVLLFYNELIFVQNSLLSVHNIAIGNVDIIFGNHDNRVYNSNEQINYYKQLRNGGGGGGGGGGEYLITSSLNTSINNRNDYGSTSNCNELFNYDEKNNILYSASTKDKLKRRWSEKNYFSQEKAFYSRNNLSVEKLHFSNNSMDDDANNSKNNLNNESSLPDILNSNDVKLNEFNSFPSFNNIDNSVNVKPSSNINNNNDNNDNNTNNNSNTNTNYSNNSNDNSNSNINNINNNSNNDTNSINNHSKSKKNNYYNNREIKQKSAPLYESVLIPNIKNTKKGQGFNDDENFYGATKINMEQLSVIPNYRNHDGMAMNNHTLHHNSSSQSIVVVNPQQQQQQQFIESDPHASFLKRFYRKVMNYSDSGFRNIRNLPVVKKLITNKSNYNEEIKKTLHIAICQGLIWGALFSFLGYAYSDNHSLYAILIFFSFLISTIVMSLISSLNPVIVKITQISDPIFVVGPLELLVQIYISILTYKIGMYLL